MWFPLPRSFWSTHLVHMCGHTCFSVPRVWICTRVAGRRSPWPCISPFLQQHDVPAAPTYPWYAREASAGPPFSWPGHRLLRDHYTRGEERVSYTTFMPPKKSEIFNVCALMCPPSCLYPGWLLQVRIVSEKASECIFLAVGLRLEKWLTGP